MNFAVTDKEERSLKMSNEDMTLEEKLNAENAALVTSFKAVLNQNWNARKELEEERERLRETNEKLQKTLNSCDSYKKRFESVSGSLRESEQENENLKSDNDSLCIGKRKLTISVVVIGIALALSVMLSIWFLHRGNQYRTLAGEIKAAVADSSLVADYVPDSVRYDYEKVFKKSW